MKAASKQDVMELCRKHQKGNTAKQQVEVFSLSEEVRLQAEAKMLDYPDFYKPAPKVAPVVMPLNSFAVAQPQPPQEEPIECDDEVLPKSTAFI